MTQYLPQNLLALFTARPPIPFKPPVDKLKKRKHQVPYGPVSDFLQCFEAVPPPPATRGETREEQAERKKMEKKAAADAILEEKIMKWDPHSDSNAIGDPFKTLFVARINYDTTESKLRRELESYGPIRNISMVYNIRTRKPRGYALVEYEHERDMHSAYKHADGKKIDGRRILVDVERGRTVKSWRPRRLGGGLGGTRRGGPDDNIRHSGRAEQWERSDRGERSERDKESRGEEKSRRRSRSPREKERRDRDKDREREREKRRDRDRGDREERDRGDREDRSERERDRERRRERRDRDRDRDRERDRRDRDGGDREREGRVRERDGGDRDHIGEESRERGRDEQSRDRARDDESRDRGRDEGSRDRGRDEGSRDRGRDEGSRDRGRDEGSRDRGRDDGGSDRGRGEEYRERERNGPRPPRDEGELPSDEYIGNGNEQSDYDMDRYNERLRNNNRNGEDDMKQMRINSDYPKERGGDDSERIDEPAEDQDTHERYNRSENVDYPSDTYQ